MKTVHQPEWTKEQIATHFNRQLLSANGGVYYFGAQRGGSVLRHTLKHILAIQSALDLGCGPGFFLGHLLKRNIECYGADISDASVDSANKRLSGNPFFHGVSVMPSETTLPFPDAVFDTVFLLETLEHLSLRVRTALLAEVHRVLQPAGHLVVTTPYNEDLQKNMVQCTVCQYTFHARQHVHSFTDETMRTTLTHSGFRPVHCKPTLFFPNGKTSMLQRLRKRDSSHCCPACQTTFVSTAAVHKKSIGDVWKRYCNMFCIAQRTAATEVR